jgi:tetratricopeptide (TPR) repeat protein
MRMTSAKATPFDHQQCLLAGRRGYLVAIVPLVFVLCAIVWAQAAVAASYTQLLRNNNVTELEALLTGVQQRFEAGELSEIDLRDAFRPFYLDRLDAAAESNLTKWASSSPRSYVAHLALGIYLRRRGDDARGGNFAADTSPESIDQMSMYHRRATEELRASIALTRKPILSVFHLLNISLHSGDRDKLITLLRQANEILPNNSLVRNTYALSLTPRWGGSYEQMDKFISATKRERVPENLVLQLVAIEEDDKGHTLEEQRQHSPAMEHFRRALELATRVGGTFARDFLPTSLYYGCSGQNPPASCW